MDLRGNGQQIRLSQDNTIREFASATFDFYCRNVGSDSIVTVTSAEMSAG